MRRKNGAFFLKLTLDVVVETGLVIEEDPSSNSLDVLSDLKSLSRMLSWSGDNLGVCGTPSVVAVLDSDE